MTRFIPTWSPILLGFKLTKLFCIQIFSGLRDSGMFLLLLVIYNEGDLCHLVIYDMTMMMI